MSKGAAKSAESPQFGPIETDQPVEAPEDDAFGR